MNNFKTISPDLLLSATGGFTSPCPALLAKPVGQINKKDLAIAATQCGVGLPSAKQLSDARRIRF